MGNRNNTAKTKKYGFWNWGTGITIAIIVACLGIIFIVYKSMQVQYDMVTEDYYGAELKQNEKVNAKINANNLSAPIKIVQSEDKFLIQFPTELTGKNIKGTIKFYRPSDVRLDVTSPIELNENGNMVISNKQFQKGFYLLQADWHMEDKKYYFEESFFVK